MTEPEMTMMQRVARAIYNLDPFYEPGEYVDGFMVSPGGSLSWEQALARDAEFGDDPRMGKVTEFASKAARTAIEEMRVPTEAMLCAGWTYQIQNPTKAWHAMIDEALK